MVHHIVDWHAVFYYRMLIELYLEILLYEDYLGRKETEIGFSTSLIHNLIYLVPLLLYSEACIKKLLISLSDLFIERNGTKT